MDIAGMTRQALDHALGTLGDASGSPMWPFALVYDDSDPDPTQRRLALIRHDADSLEAMLQGLREGLTPGPGRALYAIAWDGLATVEGRKWDAILVEVGTATSVEADVVAQRYEVRETGFFRKTRRAVAVGEPMLAGAMRSRLCAQAGEG